MPGVGGGVAVAESDLEATSVEYVDTGVGIGEIVDIDELPATCLFDGGRCDRIAAIRVLLVSLGHAVTAIVIAAAHAR